MQLVFITSPLVHWSIITFWLHPNFSMTSAVLSDTLAAPCTHSHTNIRTRSQICVTAATHTRMRYHTCKLCMDACTRAQNAGTHTAKRMQTKKSHLQTDRHRRLASVWAEIILDQYNSVSEPKHKLGPCWKTLLHASSCLCACVCMVCEMNPTDPVPPSLQFSCPLLF